MKASLVDMTEVKTDMSGTMRTKIKEWASGIRDDYKDRLKTPLINSNGETRLLSMNFDPELYSLLQEVQFLSEHLSGNFPPVAMEIYQENQVYNDYIHNTGSIVNVGRPMFQKHIWHVDQLLERGITELTWEEDGAPAFLNESVGEVSTLSGLHNTSTSNITTMIELRRESLLLNRVDPKQSLDQNEVNNTVNAQIELITQQSQGISQLVKSSVHKGWTIPIHERHINTWITSRC
jgi:dynein heavy chain